MNNLDYDIVCKNNIETFKQNKPSLIAQDFYKLGISPDISMKILLARGVFKWFGVRRKLIKEKDIWKSIIKDTIINIQKCKANGQVKKLHQLQGYLKAYEECRARVRLMCHSTRWQYPDNDEICQMFMYMFDKESKG